MTAPSQVADPASSAGTPEEYFQPRPNPEKKIPVDALNCALNRAQAVLLLLQDSGGDLSIGFTINHSSVMDSRWCIDGLLEQASIMANNINGGEVKS